MGRLSLEKGDTVEVIEEHITTSPEETIAFAKKLGLSLVPNTVLCFFGNLGAGKTTFIKGLVEGATGCSQDQVSSPTFVYLNIYQGRQKVFHFDLYRLKDLEEFLSMAFDEMFDAGGVTCVEWSEKIQEALPQDAIQVHLDHLGEKKRRITIKGCEHV